MNRLLTEALRYLRIAHGALRYLRVVHRDSEIPQGGLQRLLDTSGWLTEALRTLRVVHRGSHILYIGSQKL